MRKEIETLDDIKLLVDSFYSKVREDELLAPVFNEVIQDEWPRHLEKMYRFWQTVLLDEHTYFGRPFLPHAQLPVDQAHFNRWLQLFTATINTHFEGAKAEEALERADKMAIMFLSKINYFRNSTSQPL